MKEQHKVTSIDGYIASASPDVRDILEEIRRIVKAEVPEAVETISYQLPAFKLDRVFIYFAAFKKHIGVYPPVKGDRNLQRTLLPYRGEKGNLKFPLEQPIPFKLIGSVAAALCREYSKR
ncbi:MAG: iron chaperone [Gammaproteobacteria bacterium]